MPAIVLNRLRTSISLLKELYSKPAEFIKELHELYASFADTTHALNPKNNEVLAVPAFNSPPLLSREIEQSFFEYASDQPKITLEIIDLLWQQPEVELRRLAIYLLGKLPSARNEAIVNRILDWSADQGYSVLHPYLLQLGSTALRKEDPKTWMNILEDWKNSKEVWKNKMSLRGLTPLIEDKDYLNLPEIFTFLTSFFKDFNLLVQNDLLSVLMGLANRSEVETTYFLKQMIAFYPQRSLGRFLRQSLDLFPAQAQSSLRVAMRNQQGLQADRSNTG